MPPSSVVWFCLAQIIFAAKFGHVDCDLLQTLVNPLHSLESESSGFSAGFCFLHSACWCVCVCVQCVVQFLIRVCVLVAEFRGASLHTFLLTHTDVHHHWLIVGDLG